MYIEEIRCPKCGKLIAKAYKDYKIEKVLLWCPRCKKNIKVGIKIKLNKNNY